MDETLRSWLIGVGNIAIGFLLGLFGQLLFTKRAEKRDTRKQLANLYGRISATMMDLFGAVVQARMYNFVYHYKRRMLKEYGVKENRHLFPDFNPQDYHPEIAEQLTNDFLTPVIRFQDGNKVLKMLITEFTLIDSTNKSEIENISKQIKDYNLAFYEYLDTLPLNEFAKIQNKKATKDTYYKCEQDFQFDLLYKLDAELKMVITKYTTKK